jgi:hypothetical protein
MTTTREIDTFLRGSDIINSMLISLQDSVYHLAFLFVFLAYLLDR